MDGGCGREGRRVPPLLHHAPELRRVGGLDRAVQHQQLVPQCQVLHGEVTTGVKCCGQASQDRKNEGKHAIRTCLDSITQQRLLVRIEFLLPTGEYALWSLPNPSPLGGPRPAQGGSNLLTTD